MKTLTLIRHAKSDHSTKDIPDFERGLAPRGEKQIKEMCKILKRTKPGFDYIICSTALRTVLTYEGLAAECENFKKIPTIFAQEIYDFAEGKTEEAIELIKKIEDNITSLAIIGHNDLLDELVDKLTHVTGLHIPTLGIIQIKFEIDTWERITQKGEIKMFITPSK